MSCVYSPFWAVKQVPDGVRFCTVKTEGPVDSDVGCILLCPRNSEADFALELVKKVWSADVLRNKNAPLSVARWNDWEKGEGGGSRAPFEAGRLMLL